MTVLARRVIWLMLFAIPDISRTSRSCFSVGRGFISTPMMRLRMSGSFLLLHSDASVLRRAASVCESRTEIFIGRLVMILFSYYI